MSTFIQLHLLTSYPPSNLNRDDLGRPKTAIMGGVQRLRISSQSLKRAWRTSDLFQEALTGHIGTRTKEMGIEIFKQLCDKEVSESDAKSWAQAIASQFGKLKSKDKKNPRQELEIEQLAHFSQEEIKTIDSLIVTLAEENRPPEDAELNLLSSTHKTVDIALFGRMLASAPSFNMEAACQVAHAITVHKVAVEDDYFTAVDDLNRGDDNMGAAHIGETEFAAGFFYLYICINYDLLLKNLNNDEALAGVTLRALTECTATIAPTGKQNSFASRAYASYILVEKGTKQPRSLSVAFLKPVNNNNILDSSISTINRFRENIDKVYGTVAPNSKYVNTVTGEGTLNELLDFVAER